jgi:transposase
MGLFFCKYRLHFSCTTVGGTRVGSRELRELTRYRTKLVEERARLVNRIQKVLEDSNVKLASVATDITGVSGRAILQALLDGQQDPQRLAELARGRLRNKRDELAQAVQGTFREHHRFLLQSQLCQLDFYDSQIGVQAVPDDQVPDPSGGEPSGVQCPPSAGHASEGTQIPPPSSRQALIEAAHGAARSKNTYLGAYYQRLKKRLGSKKAIVALAHRILLIIYHLLNERQFYRELGPGHADEQAAESSKRWAIRRLEQLGFAVTLTPKECETLTTTDHEEEVA